jgi:hypothetical protein
MLIGGGDFVKKRVQLRAASETNEAANIWIQHLVNRIIIGELDLPHRLQAKLLFETTKRRK